MELLRQMVLARAFPEINPDRRLHLIGNIFENPETLDRLCTISGGHLRNLLSILSNCLLIAQNLPISKSCLEEVIVNYCKIVTLAVTDEDWKLLRQVKRRKIVMGEEQYRRLVRSLFVFEYYYKNYHWFDVNPILAETEELRRVDRRIY